MSITWGSMKTMKTIPTQTSVTRSCLKTAIGTVIWILVMYGVIYFVLRNSSYWRP